jgi:hypothetical protein
MVPPPGPPTGGKGTITMAKQKREKSLIEKIGACETVAELRALCAAGMTKDEGNAYIAKRAALLKQEEAEEAEALRAAGIVIPEEKKNSRVLRTGGESVREKLLKDAEPLRAALQTALASCSPVPQSATAAAMAQSAALLTVGETGRAASVLHGGAIVEIKGIPHARRFPTYGGSFFRGITVTLPVFNVTVPVNMRAALKAVELEWVRLTADLPAAPKGATSGDGDEE